MLALFAVFLAVFASAAVVLSRYKQAASAITEAFNEATIAYRVLLRFAAFSGEPSYSRRGVRHCSYPLILFCIFRPRTPSIVPGLRG